MKPRRIDSNVIKLLEGAGIDHYSCDCEEDIIYVDNLQLLGHRLGMKWTSQTEIGIYKGYWFKQGVASSGRR